MFGKLKLVSVSGYLPLESYVHQNIAPPLPCLYLRSNLVPRLFLSLPYSFAHAIIIARKIEGEGELGTEQHPPVAFLAVVKQEFN